MANPASFRVLVAGFALFFTSGALVPAVADPLLSRSGDARSVEPVRDEQRRSDLPVEHPSGDGGSAIADSRSSEKSGVSSPVSDPWADAVGEASRLAAVVTGVQPPYPVVLNSQVRFFLDRFTGDNRDIVGRWINRSGRYLGMIREILKSRGLPEDLAFTAMIESGFNPLAVSRAGAVGLWQFMAATARRYGLRVDRWVDERLDPEKSTFAAAAYLHDLHEQFGSWMLAQAAYNAGENSIVRAIHAAGSNDFWVLTRTRLLPQETKEFVPQILAATLIGRDPVQYGFEATDPAALGFERVTVPPSTDLKRLSVSAGMPLGTLRALNPTLVRGVTPPGTEYALKVPLGSGVGVMAALSAPKPVHVTRAAKTRAPRRAPTTVRTAPARVNGPQADTPGRIHVVRPRDTVSSIASRYGVSVGDVLRWNSLERQDAIRPGDRLKVADWHPATDHGRPASGR